jgi:hypothetical protein
MRADAADAPEFSDRRQAQSFLYDAFLSYDHDDQPVAHGIQRGQHRIARRLGQLHALRVFRDSTDLTASPDLWGKVTEAMDRSRYLIVVLSPNAVTSKWVQQGGRPPIDSAASSTCASKPLRASCIAAAKPLGPAPTTTAVVIEERRRRVLWDGPGTRRRAPATADGPACPQR